MYQPALPERDSSLWAGCLACLGALLRCLCCLKPEGNGGERGQRLLSAHAESAIEASASPPRLPAASNERAALLKGHGPSSSSALHPSASPPMPLPFFPPPRHKRAGSAGSADSRHSSSGADGGGGSPKAGDKAGKQHKSASQLSLLDDDDMCPTCLEAYSEDNPKVLTKCGHHFHLPCLYEWLERSQTCPICGQEMHFEELL